MTPARSEAGQVVTLPGPCHPKIPATETIVMTPRFYPMPPAQSTPSREECREALGTDYPAAPTPTPSDLVTPDDWGWIMDFPDDLVAAWGLDAHGVTPTFGPSADDEAGWTETAAASGWFTDAA